MMLYFGRRAFTAYMLLLISAAPTTAIEQVSVEKFLPNIAETVVHVIIDPSCLYSETAFINLIDMFKEAGNLLVSFLISPYKYKILDNATLKAAIAGEYIENPKEFHSSGLERKLDAVAYTHLYFISNYSDLTKAIQVRFVDFTLRRVFPQYIIFWSAVLKKSISWMKEFKSRISYNSFADYRLLIAKESESAKYSVWLICVICHLHRHYHAPDSYLLPLNNFDAHSMKGLWNDGHKNHHGQSIWIVQGENFQVTFNRRSIGLASALQDDMNASIIFEFHKDILGQIYFTHPLHPDNIEYILANRFPQ